jgi:hypothetical protein
MGLTVPVSPGPVGVDAAIFIYFIEEHPRFLPAILPLPQRLGDRPLTSPTSGGYCAFHLHVVRTFRSA